MMSPSSTPNTPRTADDGQETPDHASLVESLVFEAEKEINQFDSSSPWGFMGVS